MYGFTPNLGFACNFSTLQKKELKQGVKIVFLFFTFFVQNVVKKKKNKKLCLFRVLYARNIGVYIHVNIYIVNSCIILKEDCSNIIALSGFSAL